MSFSIQKIPLLSDDLHRSVCIFEIGIDQRLGADFPRTHDLKFLLDLIKGKTPVFNNLEEALVNLSVSAVEVRYPGSKPDRHEG